MCGWPAGVGYPPTDGELELAITAEPALDAEPTTHDADHVGVQLDALTGMVERQGQPLATESASTDSPEDAGDTQAAPSADEDADEPALEVPAPAAQSDDEASQSAAGVAVEIDPLTAPLTALTGASDRAEATLLEPVLEPDAPTVEATASVESQVDLVDESAAPAEEFDSPVETQTAGRAAALLRPAQLLIVGTAALNLVLVSLDAVLGTATGSMTMVVLGLALITLGVWTGAAVTFLHWVSRAHTHVAVTASARQRHGASMSLIGWFIPIAGIVIGYRVLQDLWTGSDPATRDNVDAAPTKVRMIDVWLLGIVTAALFGYAMPLALGDSALWGAISGIGLLVAALALVSVMGVISSWQGVGINADLVASSAAPEHDGAAAGSDEAPQADLAPEPVSVAAE